MPASSRALCALTSPGVNILASGMLFSGQRVSELRCERQVTYVLRRLGGSERSTELARSTPTAVSLTTQTSTRTTQTMVLTIIKNKRGRFDGLDTKDKKAAADALSLKTDWRPSPRSHLTSLAVGLGIGPRRSGSRLGSRA